MFGWFIGIAFYLFLAYSLFQMALKRNLEMSWLAWIPIAQMYILGQLVPTVKIGTFEIPNVKFVLPAAQLINIIFGSVKFLALGSLISLAQLVLLLLVLNNLYKQYVPEKATLYTVLSIFGVTIPFFIYMLKDKEPVNIP